MGDSNQAGCPAGAATPSDGNAGGVTSRAGSRAMNDSPPVRILIEPRSGWQLIDWGALWRYRELLGFLMWRDVQVRYKQTALGIVWAVLQPLATMAVFALFFGRLGGMAKNVEENYALFVFAGLLPWQLFAAIVGQASVCLLSSSNLISKVFFPRLIIPLSAVGSPVVDAGVSVVILVGLVAATHSSFSPALLLAPVFLAGTVVAAVGIGTLLSALVIQYRDFRHITPLLLQVWMFASPVAYPLSVIPPSSRLIYSLNPMVGMICGFRWALLAEPCEWPCVIVSALSALVWLALGLFCFRQVERRFADIV